MYKEAPISNYLILYQLTFQQNFADQKTVASYIQRDEKKEEKKKVNIEPRILCQGFSH